MSRPPVARALIVDDEAPARHKLVRFLAEDDRFALAGEAADGSQAVEQIASLEPDLVFLDIQLPGFDGLEVLASLPRATLPHVIFTTAHAEFAVKAFELRAVDYLLKPFDRERFRSACDAYWERRGGDRGEPWRLVESLRSGPAHLERLLVRQNDRLIVVRLLDVCRISAEEHYVRLHTAHGTHLHRMAIQELAARLDPRRFVRVHRCEIVNLEQIAGIEPAGHGDAVIHLRDGSEVFASRSFRREWEGRLGR